MASQTDATAPKISSDVVGFAFVNLFYLTLHTSPEEGYRFFTELSTMNRPGPSGELVTVTTMEGIKDVILSLDCQNYNADILTADFQASHKGGITVLVTGCLTGQDNIRRKFTESFFLAPQEKGYYVHNNAFRFTDDAPVVTAAEPTSVEVIPEEHAPAVTVEPVIDEVLVQETVQVADNSLENHTVPPEEKVETITEPIVQEEVEKWTIIEKSLPQPSVDSNIDVQPVGVASMASLFPAIASSAFHSLLLSISFFSKRRV